MSPWFGALTGVAVAAMLTSGSALAANLSLTGTWQGAVICSGTTQDVSKKFTNPFGILRRIRVRILDFSDDIPRFAIEDLNSGEHFEYYGAVDPVGSEDAPTVSGFVRSCGVVGDPDVEANSFKLDEIIRIIRASDGWLNATSIQWSDGFPFAEGRTTVFQCEYSLRRVNRIPPSPVPPSNRQCPRVFEQLRG